MLYWCCLGREPTLTEKIHRILFVGCRCQKQRFVRIFFDGGQTIFWVLEFFVLVQYETAEHVVCAHRKLGSSRQWSPAMTPRPGFACSSVSFRSTKPNIICCCQQYSVIYHHHHLSCEFETEQQKLRRHHLNTKSSLQHHWHHSQIATVSHRSQYCSILLYKS